MAGDVSSTGAKGLGWGRVAILYFPLVGLLATVFVDRTLWDTRLLQVHHLVLQGKAPNVAQFQLPLHDTVLDALFRLSPKRSAGVFAALYILYYSLGLVLFFEVLYRTCARHAGALAALLACLYYVATVPMFWYDNWYHPSDPWGALVSVLLVRCLFEPSPSVRYYALLLLSGFVWDKSVFFPFSRAVSGFGSERGKFRVALEFAAGTALAATGQFAYRWYYGYQPAGVGSLSKNLLYLPWYVLGLVVFQGPALAYLVRNVRRLPRPFAGLMAQTPAWFALYVAMNGYLWEYRAVFFVAVAYSAPLLALFCAEFIRTASHRNDRPAPAPPLPPERVCPGALSGV